MKYSIAPGLYGVGDPNPQSPVLVTANYKLTFDKLRAQLNGVDAWILVLDTRGINVWCAAGKGTFGTQELVNRLSQVKLPDVVSHKQLIVPQLGAPGIAAHEVTKATGFNVIYGPIKAVHIKRFLENDLGATAEMRVATFRAAERLALAPVELIKSFTLVPVAFTVLFLIYLLRDNPFSAFMWYDFLLFLGVLFSATVLFALLLPWLPFRSFSLKGCSLGVLVVLMGSALYSMSDLDLIANLLLMTPVCAFFTLNFTGSTTFTSLSGVQKEMRYAVPALVIAFVMGIAVKIFA